MRLFAGAAVPVSLMFGAHPALANSSTAADIAAPLRAAGRTVHVIGGAHEAGELDAKRAIAQGAQVAAAL